MYKACRIYKTVKIVKNLLQIAFHKVYNASPTQQLTKWSDF